MAFAQYKLIPLGLLRALRVILEPRACSLQPVLLLCPLCSSVDNGLFPIPGSRPRLCDPRSQIGRRSARPPSLKPQAPSLKPDRAFPLYAPLAQDFAIGKAQLCADCQLRICLCAPCWPKLAPFARTNAPEPKTLNQFKKRAVHPNALRPSTLRPPGPFFTAHPSQAEIGQMGVKRDAPRRTPATPLPIAFSQLIFPNYWFPII
jgi:hypothetical protein